MDHARRRRGILAGGMVLAALLVAGCGMQTSQSERLEEIRLAPANTRIIPLGAFAAPQAEAVVRPGLSVDQVYALDDFEERQSTRILPLKQQVSQTQAATMTYAQVGHHCEGH
jgi:hypothetical protein